MRKMLPPCCVRCPWKTPITARVTGPARNTLASHRLCSFRLESASSRTARTWVSNARKPDPNDRFVHPCPRYAGPACNFRNDKRLLLAREVFLQAATIGLSLGAQYALLALGFTLIFGILG